MNIEQLDNWHLAPYEQPKSIPLTCHSCHQKLDGLYYEMSRGNYCPSCAVNVDLRPSCWMCKCGPGLQCFCDRRGPTSEEQQWIMWERTNDVVQRVDARLVRLEEMLREWMSKKDQTP